MRKTTMQCAKLVPLILMTAVALAGVSAQDQNSDDEFFGTDESALVLDLDQQEADAANTNKPVELPDLVKVGGALTVNTSASANANHLQDYLSGNASAITTLDLSTTLFVDARPTKDLRMFIKGQAEYPFLQAEDFSVRELFADLTLGDLYVRAGKQTVNWGVGRYFSPANVINLGNKDPEDPDAELVGPVAVKLQLPVDSSNYYVYGILQDMETKGTVGLAAKGEWVLGNVELGLGGVYRPAQPWAVTATASGALWGVDLYAEAALKGADDRTYVVADDASPLDVSTESRKDDLALSATIGFSWSWSDETEAINLNLSGQYYLNGSGYPDSSLFAEHASGIKALIASGLLDAGDLYLRGRHYGAATVSLSDIAGTGFGFSVFWLGNIGDGSGKIVPSLTYEGIANVRLGVSFTEGYGEVGGEYSPNGAMQSISISASLTSLKF